MYCYVPPVVARWIYTSKTSDTFPFDVAENANNETAVEFLSE